VTACWPTFISGDALPIYSDEFGSAFSELLDAAGLTVDRLATRLAGRPYRASRSTLYDWKNGQHLPAEPDSFLNIVKECLAIAAGRGVRLSREDLNDASCWQDLLARAKSARFPHIVHNKVASSSLMPSAEHGRPIRSWDPFGLGVKKVIDGGPLPTYVKRFHDEILRAVLEPRTMASRLVVLRGGSSTGKSRAAYEAVIGQLSDWQLEYPLTPAALIRRVSAGIAPRTVVWLNELRNYAEPDGGPEALADLAHLLATNQQIIAITSLWPDDWDAYTDGRHSRTELLSPVGVTRGLLDPLPDLTASQIELIDPARGGVIDVPAKFTPDDIARAHESDDPVIEQAIQRALAAGAEGQVTQYLAGVPALLLQMRGPSKTPYGTFGRAVIVAAMDASRLGRTGPYTPELLHEAVIGYLTDQERTRSQSTWWNQALAYATEELVGAVKALEPIPPEQGTGVAGYIVADYLDQLRRSTRRTNPGPASLWSALIRHTSSPGDLARIAHAAHIYGLDQHEAFFWRQAVLAGDGAAGNKLIEIIRTQDPGSLDFAFRWVAEHITLHDLTQAWLLLKNMREAGAEDAVAILLARDPDQKVEVDDARSVGYLVSELREAGANDAAIELANRAVGTVNLKYPSSVAQLLHALHEAGADEAKTTLLARNPAKHCAVYHPSDVAWLLGCLDKLGNRPAATTLAARAAGQVSLSDIRGVGMLLQAMHEAEANKEVAVLGNRAVADAYFDDPWELADLLHVLSVTGPQAAVAKLIASVSAENFDITEPTTVGTLIDALREVGAEEAANALAVEAAGAAGIYDAGDLSTLLYELQGTEDAVDILASHAVTLDYFYDSEDLTGVLQALRYTGHPEAADEVAFCASDSADLGDPAGVADLLDVLRQAGAEEAVAALLARDPAGHADLGDPAGVADLLCVLRQAGAEEAVAALLTRDPAGHADLGDPAGVARLLMALRQAGAERAVTVLANRAATGVSLGDRDAITWLMNEIYDSRAWDAMNALLARVDELGKFDINMELFRRFRRSASARHLNDQSTPHKIWRTINQDEPSTLFPKKNK
jgi:hypothetical protein